MSEILQLAEEAERKFTSRFVDAFPGEFEINAFLYHNPLLDPRVMIKNTEEIKKGGFDGGYVVVPVQFFHVDVEIPADIRIHANLLKILGI